MNVSWNVKEKLPHVNNKIINFMLCSRALYYF
jgi:hypothetical protein